jgi:isocitrate dehydrogenase kinase/phosphatase
MKHHADLLDAAFWQAHKERIQAGHMLDVFPYDQDKRFGHRRQSCSTDTDIADDIGD